MRPDTRSMLAVFTTVALATAPSVSFAKEYPIGTPFDVAGMEIGAVYLQPIKMDPPDIMAPAAATDIHLEADIHALADNADGFAEGAWMPYLRITYELTKAGGNTVTGKLMPMVASDGPHYGDNVKLDGVGKYHLTFTIEAPGPEFGRHVDKETGIGPWFKPLTTSFDFVFAGVGKIGSY